MKKTEWKGMDGKVKDTTEREEAGNKGKDSDAALIRVRG
jgi:hypothetical protein